MDAHLFRRVCEALVPYLKGARLEKIQDPARDVLCLSFYAQRRKLHLLVKYGRRDSFLCGVKERPAGPSEPSPQVMRLRKHVQGRRVRSCVVHWPQRRLYMLFSGAPDDARPCWLYLDARLGAGLETREEPCSDSHVRWPSPEELPCALKEWRDWPVLTPALRRTLPLLEELEQQALLTDLAAGGGDIFVYDRDAELEFSAWPLPDVLRGKRGELVFEDVFEAANLLAASRLSSALAAEERKADIRSQRREAQRLKRLLEKLDAEERRLRDLAGKQREALVIQEQLWRYPPDFNVAELFLNASDGSVVRIRPDPGCSLREYMERLFHNAGRGRRGLVMLEQRRAELRMRLARGESMPRPVRKRSGISTKDAGIPQKTSDHAGLPANVRAFTSSDGIMLLRGRDAEGNWALLRLARPYDLWMHVEGGPGAHVLVRSEPGREIPQRSLDEAANLALVKSWQRGSANGIVICARARHVRPVRGGKPGTVRVDKVECVLELRLDPDIELRVARLISFDI